MTRSRALAALALSLALLGGPAATGSHAQCMLANPSFEISGQSGAIFGGWNQFGSVGSSTSAVHGSKAARVSGPNTGGWDISAFWQGQTSAPGDTWLVAGFVRVPSARPLAAQSRAIVNIEWRDAGGGLVSYESHEVASPASPQDTSLAFSFLTAAAPAGTASARLLLAVLQGPGDPQRDAIFDRVRFEKQTTPSLADKQWGDFGGGRTLSFAGRTWRVKGPGYYGPGPSSFSNSPSAVWTDTEGSLHLTIAQSGGTWYSTEVALVEPLGYGDYVFTTRGRMDTFHPTTVLGLFVWEYGPCYDGAYLWWNAYNETDIEFSRWGNAAGPNMNYVTQPYDWGGNIQHYYVSFSANEVTSHAFRWKPDRVEHRSWRGGPDAEATSPVIAQWTYTGPHIPRPDQPRVHMNMWQFAGAPSTLQEAVIEDFRFTPWPLPLLDAPAALPVESGGARLALVSRNPASGGATLRCVLPRGGALRVALHDAAGRAVRVLDAGERAAGAHELAWDGRDEDGRRVAPGVYLARMSAGADVAVARVVVLW